MAETIRRIEEKDFEAVSALYNGRKSVEELKWLYTDPDEPGKYTAFIARDHNDNIVGEIAYSLSTYIKGDKQVKGAIPFNWKIVDGYKGMAGILLFKKVLDLGDFNFAIGGTEIVYHLFSLFKLKKELEIVQFYKILDLHTFIRSYKRKSLLKTYGMVGYLLPSRFKKLGKKNIYHDLELIPYDGSNYSEEIDFENVFRKKMTKKYLDWLMACPVVKAHAFLIKKGNKKYGICILYIREIAKVKRGRIAYLPFLGEDKQLWNTVITKCTSFLKQEKCCFITGQSFHSSATASYKESGFINIEKHNYPLFLKDSKKTLNSGDLLNWHLQYTEGDKAYREF